jgi:hypothetical protein
MALKNMSLSPDATVGITAGAETFSFIDDGVTIQNGLHLVDKLDANYQERRQITVKNRPSVVDAKTGAWGKDKKTITLVRPVILTSGQIVFNTLRLEREVHPSSDAGMVAEMLTLGAALLVGPDVGDFWSVGSLS